MPRITILPGATWRKWRKWKRKKRICSKISWRRNRPVWDRQVIWKTRRRRKRKRKRRNKRIKRTKWSKKSWKSSK